MKIIRDDGVQSFIDLLKKRASDSIVEDDIQRTVRKIIAMSKDRVTGQ
jgi:hypothetical protein